MKKFPLNLRPHPLLLLLLLSLLAAGVWGYKYYSGSPALSNYHIGQPVDSLNGVYVYYNGGTRNISGRNTTPDGYNLGLKYQCVEFVKRYYYEYLDHKMIDSYGHAKDFFQKGEEDGSFIKKRGLFQYRNGSRSKPQVNDLVIFDASITNKYGHVAIISKVKDYKIEIIQQNPGKYSPSRESFLLDTQQGKWRIKNERILGWLRKQ